MQPIKRFRLERHHWGTESSPHRSKLLLGDSDTGFAVTGNLLLHEFETQSSFVLITSCGTAFDEAFAVTLLDKRIKRVVAERVISTSHHGGWLRDVQQESDNCLGLHLTLDGCQREDVYWRVTIRTYGIPLIRPRIGLSRLTEWTHQIRLMHTDLEPQECGCRKNTESFAAYSKATAD